MILRKHCPGIKNIGNTYQLILAKGIGNMLKHGITPNEDFASWLNEYCSA